MPKRFVATAFRDASGKRIYAEVSKSAYHSIRGAIADPNEPVEKWYVEMRAHGSDVDSLAVSTLMTPEDAYPGDTPEISENQ